MLHSTSGHAIRLVLKFANSANDVRGALIVPINSASAAFLPQRELTARHD
jgi:hypothetical protein